MESAKLQPKSTKKKLSAVTNKSKSDLDKEERNIHISVSAYYKAQTRGFEPGYALADWLTAEAEVNQ